MHKNNDMSYFDVKSTDESNFTDEQLADAKYVVTELGRYEEAEHRLAFQCWRDVLERRQADEDIDSHTLFKEVGEANGVSTTTAVQYYNYADLYSKWSNV